MPSQSLPQIFQQRKKHILSLLSTPSSTYDDFSPKGSLDTAIIPLIESINAEEGFVTTSSCAGRISVFLEGEKRAGDQVECVHDQAWNSERAQMRELLEGLKAPTMALAGLGGKGGGGSWMFVSHEALNTTSVGERGLTGLFGLGKMDVDKTKGAKRFVHLKFEAMVSHALSEMSISG
jgi:tRNA wybutosine-synthesizing protein 3